jgi:hypothetical protein
MNFDLLITNLSTTGAITLNSDLCKGLRTSSSGNATILTTALEASDLKTRRPNTNEESRIYIRSNFNIKFNKNKIGERNIDTITPTIKRRGKTNGSMKVLPL